MLTVLLSIVIFFITPIFINGKFYFNKKHLKLFYKITLFGFIKILKGYAEVIEEGIIIHLTKKKALLIPYNNIFEIRKKVEPLRDYHLIKANFYFNLGNEESLFLPITFSFLINYAQSFIAWFFYHKKPYFDINTSINIYEKENVFEIKFDGTVVFNLLMILFSLIKILVGKMFYAIAK